MIEVYTDGSYFQSSDTGGIGVFVPQWDFRLALCQSRTTNNRMELSAIYLGLLVAWEHAPKGSEVVILSDSQYALNSIFKWYAGWEKNGFRTANKKPVKNLALVQNIHRLYREVQALGVGVSPQWVKGHNGNPGNEEADRLSNWRAPLPGNSYALAMPNPWEGDPPLTSGSIPFGTDPSEQLYWPVLDVLAGRAG